MEDAPVKKEKSAATISYERETKIKRIKERLNELKEYKKILIEDGLQPDADDKVLESELIVQLLRLEKGLTAKAKPKKKGTSKTKDFDQAKEEEDVGNSRKNRSHAKPKTATPKAPIADPLRPAPKQAAKPQPRDHSRAQKKSGTPLKQQSRGRRR